MKNFLIGATFVSAATVLVSLLLIFISPMLFRIVTIALGVVIIGTILFGLHKTLYAWLEEDVE